MHHDERLAKPLLFPYKLGFSIGRLSELRGRVYAFGNAKTVYRASGREETL